MTEWSRSGPTGCDEPHNRRRYGDLDVGHQRSRAVIGESYNLPAAAVACGPSGRPRAARCTRPRLSGYGLPRGRFPGRLSRFGWGRLAVGARGVSLVAFVSTRSGDGATAGQRVPLRQRMRVALKLLFGPAKTAGG